MNFEQPVSTCANCFNPIEGSGLSIDSQVYCCTGCVAGGPCTCVYPGNSTPNVDDGPASLRGKLSPASSGAHEPIEVSPAIEPEANLAGLVDSFSKEVDIVRQAAAKLQQSGADTDTLSQVLRQAARLLELAADQLSGEPVHQVKPAPLEQVTRMGKTWESVQLTVKNMSSPAMVDQYASALEKLDSVNEIMLLKVDGATVHYQVWTTTNAKFTREILALPGYRPARVQASAEHITVTLPASNIATAKMPEYVAEDGQQTERPAPEVSSAVGAVLSATASAPANSTTEVGSEAFFNARHYLTVDGKPGPIEMRSWRVEISLAGDQFDNNGALAGFDTAQLAIKEVLAGYNNRLLNDIEPYNRISPTPENIARVLYGQIKASLANHPLRLKSLKIWATPTQYALYAEQMSHAA